MLYGIQKGKPMHPEQIEAEIMKLDLDTRAKLAERIILSLDAPSDEENLHLWVLEAERRLKDLKDGRAREVPAENVFRRARAAILCKGLPPNTPIWTISSGSGPKTNSRRSRVGSTRSAKSMRSSGVKSLLIDANIYTHALKGDQQVVSMLRGANKIGIWP
jgi:putative addiction module component (TIGR02574 family)